MPGLGPALPESTALCDAPLQPPDPGRLMIRALELVEGGRHELLIAIFVLALTLPVFAQSSPKKAPGYNPAAEAVYKGTVEDLRDRQCPVSGGMGSHIIMRLENDRTIEVHLATTEFTKVTELNLNQGDKTEVTGWKTEFEGVQTIFAPPGPARTCTCSARRTAPQRGR